MKMEDSEKRSRSNTTVSRLHEITFLLSRASLCDILIPGFYHPGERNSIFHPQPRMIYLVFQDDIISCKSVDQYHRLRMNITSEVNPKLPVDEDDEIGLASMFELLIGDAYTSVRCTHFRYFLDPGSDPVSGLVKCAELCFETTKTIFLDPTYTFGVHIGNTEQRDRWINDYFNVSDEYTEHWWKRA